METLLAGSTNAQLGSMLLRPLTFENLEDRQLLAGASFEPAPSSTALPASAPVAAEAASQPGSDPSSTDADAGEYAPNASPSSRDGAPGAPSSVAASDARATAAAGANVSNQVEIQYASAIAAAIAQFANQRTSDVAGGSFGPYASYADMQRMLSELAAATAQSLIDQATLATRAEPNQGPVLARGADAPVTQAPAAATIAQQAAPAQHNELGQGNEPGQRFERRSVANEAGPDPAEATIRVATRSPSELRTSSNVPADDQAPPEATAAALPSFSTQLEPLLAGVLPVDLPALRAGVGQFFTRLDALGAELADPDVAWRIGAWTVIAAGAAAALEFARAAAKEGLQREPLLFGGWRLPPPPRPKENPR